ncbi:cysteine--tRNA ligase [Isachenkonia alkalipeptolytica]|uniref:Cysteine--tRNA ligase n=1 Tax=Isachenkonia alkalipeptolytica TaxID=2565777 RepID=A0AA44BEK0_9CLOT|nr:cysteine--tRNA ligase [Isachenkonia alkalipeptolytica]NBG89037.1 cysteine--tRNA ligase [Isachenkonia alkalipeptolytica]
MKLYNTLTKEKEDFQPLVPGEIRMYACGPTVYDLFHIGNARTFMVFDAMRRYFQYRGYKVHFVQNFTDIDDKIINKAKDQGVTSEAISEKFIKEYFKDADSLGIERADVHPKVTENIPEIIEIIRTLQEKGYAYEIQGDVYFDVTGYKDYGRLSKQNLEDLQQGSRVEVDERKKSPLDFVLWKSSKEGEPSWESPWGKGRPGWHIECSAMAKKYLGETIDIHGGGGDLVFPHHENEVAQSEAATGKTFANYWIHVGYLNVNNEKMSKSLGNFFTVRDIRREFDLEVLRFFMLSAHYRNPLNFSKELLISAKSGLERLYHSKENLERLLESGGSPGSSEEEKELVKRLEEYEERFIRKMDDDFNTADGISVIFDLVKDLNTHIGEGTSGETVSRGLELLKRLTGVLGLLEQEEEVLEEEIEALIEQRQEARKNKDYELADEIRDRLQGLGIELKDTPQGVQWRRKS